MKESLQKSEVENRKYTFADYILAAAFTGGIAFSIVSYRVLVNKGEVGGTGEMSLLLTFLLGTLCYAGNIILSLIISVVMVLLLTFKLKIHSFVERLGLKGVRTVIQFVIIPPLILPCSQLFPTP